MNQNQKFTEEAWDGDLFASLIDGVDVGGRDDDDDPPEDEIVYRYVLVEDDEDEDEEDEPKVGWEWFFLGALLGWGMG